MSNRAAHVAPLPGATSHRGFDAGWQTVLRVLAESVEVLDQRGIPYVLIGGLASAILGRQRCSGDIDFLVKPEDARGVLAALRGSGFATEETNEHWLFKGTKDGVLTDVLFKAKGDIYLDTEMLARARRREFRDIPVRVIPPEDLVVMKALAHDEETPRHWYDAIAVLATSPIDWDYLVRRAAKGPRRVSSLLLYAQSVDVAVPEHAIRTLVDGVFTGCPAVSPGGLADAMAPRKE